MFRASILSFKVIGDLACDCFLLFGERRAIWFMLAICSVDKVWSAMDIQLHCFVSSCIHNWYNGVLVVRVLEISEQNGSELYFVAVFVCCSFHCETCKNPFWVFGLLAVCHMPIYQNV